MPSLIILTGMCRDENAFMLQFAKKNTDIRGRSVKTCIEEEKMRPNIHFPSAALPAFETCPARTGTCAPCSAYAHGNPESEWKCQLSRPTPSHSYDLKTKKTKFLDLKSDFFCCFWPYTRVTLKLLTTPPPSRTKTKIYSPHWDSMILRCSLWGLNPSLDCLNQDRKRGKKSTFARNLNIALTPSSASPRVKTAFPCVRSLSFENREE